MLAQFFFICQTSKCEFQAPDLMYADRHLFPRLKKSRVASLAARPEHNPIKVKQRIMSQLVILRFYSPYFICKESRQS